MDFDISYEKIAFRGQKNMPSYGATHKFKIVKPHVDYIVQAGDTLQGISLKHNITMDELKRLNKIWTNDSLFINRVIKIPLSKTDGANLFNNPEYRKSPYNHDKLDSRNGDSKFYFQNMSPESPSAGTTPVSRSPNTRVPPHPLSQEYATYYEALTPSLLGPELNRLSNSSNQGLSRASSHNPLFTGMPQNRPSGLHSSNSTPNTNCSRRSPRVAIKNGYLKAILPNAAESLLSSRTNSSSASNDFDDPYTNAEMIEL